MQLFFKLIEGRTTSLHVDGSTDVLSVKMALEALTGVSSREMRLKSAHHSSLSDANAIGDYDGVANGSTVEVLLRIRGGGRKVAYFYDGKRPRSSLRIPPDVNLNGALETNWFETVRACAHAQPV